MPRLYAQIKEVFVSGFNVTVTWLEPDPYDEEPIQRYEKDLPVSVGRFKLGKDETIKDHTRFSHLVHCNKGSSAGKFCIYPRIGETWAIFKGRYKSLMTSFDINWLADPGSPWKYQYAFVEIVSEDAGSSDPLSAGFLHKAKGFLSLFCRFNEEIVTSYVRNSDVYQFSHCVPSFKTTGKKQKVCLEVLMSWILLHYQQISKR
uniref:DUF3444 domain-containing protein n=1 Tax=Arabidopsis thaliana TaxID=3702 RepID=Q5Q0A6_ARATH|nr:hypothetical protein AT5G18710 [Arabidopsis thaliana]AAV68881.1 hypothetical protein AT5G18710 [Arabidopsis thaliana]